jgi:hypothetical protein
MGAALRGQREHQRPILQFFVPRVLQFATLSTIFDRDFRYVLLIAKGLEATIYPLGYRKKIPAAVLSNVRPRMQNAQPLTVCALRGSEPELMGRFFIRRGMREMRGLCEMAGLDNE